MRGDKEKGQLQKDLKKRGRTIKRKRGKDRAEINWNLASKDARAKDAGAKDTRAKDAMAKDEGAGGAISFAAP
jgi:hypothetical protein